MFGSLPGDVSAQALFARETAVGLRPSSVPVIQIEAAAGSRDGALRLADATVEAFTSWLVAEQEEAKVPPRQRILIERLRSPDVTESGGNSYWVAVLVLLAVASGFAALIVALASLFPKRAPVLVAAGAPALVTERAPAHEPVTEAAPIAPERVAEPPVMEAKPVAPPVTNARPVPPKRVDESKKNDVVLTDQLEHRSEEHTSELQSRQYLVCRLLLDKKKNERNLPLLSA